MDGEKVRVLGDEIARTMAAIDRTEHKLLGLLRELDAAKGWAASGQLSFAAWLSWRCGIGPLAARERVRVARALAELPKIETAFGAGAITYSKARALTRVATAENEETLVSMAGGMTAAELEKLCQMMRRAHPETGETGETGETKESEPARRFSQRTDQSGMVRMTITVTADEAAVVCAALEVCAPTPNRRAEGLVAMADECLRGSASDRSPTEVILHVSADDLSATTNEGAIVSAEAAKRSLCDAGVVAMVRGGLDGLSGNGATLDVGRKTRVIPTAIRRAMAVRDRGCRFPGCSHVIVDGHHVEHWCDGGATKLENLVSLCRSHHRFLHEGGGSVETTAGRFIFRDSRGVVLEHAPAASASVMPNREDAWTAVAKDELRPLDWDSISDALGA